MPNSTIRDNKRIEKVAAIIAALFLWQLIAMFVGNQLLLVTPMVVINTLLELLFTSSFWSAVAFSFFRIVFGFLMALFLGIVLATVAGRFHLTEIMLQPYISVVKATPVASFIILCLIWLNAQNLSVFIAFLMVLPIVYTNVLQGIKSTDEKLLEMATVFEVSWWRRLHYIYIPHLKPFLLSACSVSIGLSWKAGIAAEVIGIPEGSIGEMLYEAKVYLSSGDLFAWTVVIVVISIMFEKIFIRSLKAFFARKERV
jgi:NitT/TauT family transport system permease protein